MYRIRPDLIIIACGLSSALDLVSLIRTMRGLCGTPVIMITSRQPSRYYMEKLRVAYWMEKPVEPGALLRQVRRIVEPDVHQQGRAPTARRHQPASPNSGKGT
jgi:DNA-binding response OmpR family regulator